ncbi:hypothetical protein QYE76_012943 [Lolium multiflorum]|uniref:Uncharacterized protein n=1 Tax=Lolium multiflorum TaxID=4521 RepID=A0AAD8TY10_LOLMU|nr:hypothetical protein QYE76_012943 [Lolium multiflorum]
MAVVDLGSAEWERSKISTQDINLLKKLGISKKPKALCFPSEESYPTPPMGYRNTRGKELSGIQITAYFLRTRVQPLQARKFPLWKYAGDKDADRLSADLEVKDLEKLVRKISSLSKKDPVPSSCRVKPYSATNALPKNHPNLVSLPPLPEGGEVDERAVVTDDNQDAPSFVNEPVDSQKSAGSSEKEAASEGTASAQSPPPAAAYDPYLEASSALMMRKKYQLLMWLLERVRHILWLFRRRPSKERNPRLLNKTSTLLLLLQAPCPFTKRARVEIIPEPTLQSGSSSSPLLDDPMIKELIRIGAQFIGYREYASKTEEKLAEANKLVDTLAQKLEQSEAARKKAELDASKAKAEADKAKACWCKTNQEFELEDPDNDPLLDALSVLELNGTEAREGIEQADAGLSRLFPYFFPKKAEPKTFLALAKDFNPPEDLGLKMRQENMKIAVESTVALVADSQQTIDWTKVGNTEQIEQTQWRSLIRAAKPNTKKILAYLGIKPSSTPSSSKPEV